MANTIHLDIVSAEGEIFSGNVDMVFVPASEGDIGIAPRHAPLLTTLKPGEVRVKTGDQEESFYVGGGALEIQPHQVTVLADTAARASDLDEAAALAAAVAGAKYSIRLGSLLLAMAAARCTPAVVLRSQSAAARSVFRFTASMVSVTSPICCSLNTANRLVSSDRERMRPSTQARRLAMDS